MYPVYDTHRAAQRSYRFIYRILLPRGKVDRTSNAFFNIAFSKFPATNYTYVSRRMVDHYQLLLNEKKKKQQHFRWPEKSFLSKFWAATP